MLANVPKTVVNYLLEYLLEKTKHLGIHLTLKKPASVELAADQADEKDLMPFPVLRCVLLPLRRGENVAGGGPRRPPREHDPQQLDAWTRRFARLFTQSIFKWVQTPLTLHLGNLDLDRERALQLPVVQETEWW